MKTLVGVIPILALAVVSNTPVSAAAPSFLEFHDAVNVPNPAAAAQNLRRLLDSHGGGLDAAVTPGWVSPDEYALADGVIVSVGRGLEQYLAELLGREPSRPRTCLISFETEYTPATVLAILDLGIRLGFDRLRLGRHFAVAQLSHDLVSQVSDVPGVRSVLDFRHAWKASSGLDALALETGKLKLVLHCVPHDVTKAKSAFAKMNVERESTSARLWIHVVSATAAQLEDIIALPFVVRAKPSSITLGTPTPQTRVD